MSVERLNSVVKSIVRKRRFLVDVNNWDCEFRDKLRAFGSDGTTVACSSGGATRELMSNESRLLDFLAAAVMAMVICSGKPSGSVFVNTNVASWERLGIAKNSTQFWSIVPRWRRKTS